MALKIELTEKVYWLGFNDRQKQRFENQCPLDKGVTYNTYLIDDEKTALIDTAESPFASDLVDWIKELLGNKPLDYLIVNHMEPDHSGAIKDVVTAYPDIKIYGNRQTFPMLEAFYSIDKESFVTIKENDTLSLGKHTLQFITVPMVHWPESMVTYDQTDKILFSNDAFGSFGTIDGAIFDDELNIGVETYNFDSEARRYYSNILGKFGNQTQRALKKLGELELSMIAPAHGFIWRKNISYVLDCYQKWSKMEGEEGVVIVYGSMYGNTERMADYIARFLVEQGVKNVVMHDSASTHSSYIISDIWKYKSVILGGSTYNSDIFPPMAHLMSELQHYGLKNRFLSIFGSSSWSGGGVKAIKKFAENIKWEIVGEEVEVKCTSQKSDIEKCREIAKVVAEKLKS